MRGSLLCLFILAMAACSGETVLKIPGAPVDWHSLEQSSAPAASEVAPTIRERAIADTLAASFASESFRDFSGILDSNAYFAFVGERNAFGRDNVIHAHKILFEGLANRTLTIHRVLMTESTQSIEWTLSAEHLPTSKAVTFNGLTLLSTKDDGSVTSIRHYFDEAVLLAQTGAGPDGLPRLPAAEPIEGQRIVVEQAGTDAERTNLSTVLASLDALENKNEKAYLAAMAHDIEVAVLSSSPPIRGLSGLREYYRSIHRSIGHLDTQLVNAYAMGSLVVVEYKITGEQRGTIAWVSMHKDNLPKMFVVDVADMREGKISKLWRYDSPMQAIPIRLRGLP